MFGQVTQTQTLSMQAINRSGASKDYATEGSGEALALVHTAMATKKIAILENILKMVGGGVICDSAMERTCG
jgi:mevalonate pyrophosphate decarboxylase